METKEYFKKWCERNILSGSSKTKFSDVLSDCDIYRIHSHFENAPSVLECKTEDVSHKTDGTPCWCNPKIIKVKPKKMDKVKCFKENPLKCVYCGKIRAFNESDCKCECHIQQNNCEGILSGADKDDRFCNSHNDNSSFIEVIECNECNFYLK